jgi:hypothetical protein
LRRGPSFRDQAKLSYDAKDKKWHASMDANADQQKAAPEYKYPSNT